MNQIQKLHVGVYGIIKNSDSILVVRKSRGPYKGLYDLPGGKLRHGEPILTGLRREILEETGIEPLSFCLMDNFAFTASYQDHNSPFCELYHFEEKRIRYKLDFLEKSGAWLSDQEAASATTRYLHDY